MPSAPPERDPLLPTAAGNSVLRRMIVLHILDALPDLPLPESASRHLAVWRVMASTDPVALTLPAGRCYSTS